jgi:hypothetical protein
MSSSTITPLSGDAFHDADVFNESNLLVRPGSRTAYESSHSQRIAFAPVRGLHHSRLDVGVRSLPKPK